MTATHSGNGHGDQEVVADARPVMLVRFRSGLVGETARSVHLVPLPSCDEQPRAATALCGTLLRADEIEMMTLGEGMPCTACVISQATPSTALLDRELASPSSTPDTVSSADQLSAAARSPGIADYRVWDWPVTLRGNQIWLRLQHDLSAIMIPAALAVEVTAILTQRRCSPAVLEHPYAPGHHVLLAGEKYGVALPWPPSVQRITGAVLLPPSTTPRGPVTWVHSPERDTLRICRETDLFAALRTARSDRPSTTGQGLVEGSDR